MRRLCAWCGADMGYRCDHCNKPLIRATLVHTAESGKKTQTEAAICLNSVPPFVFEITERTPTTHGMCQQCAALNPIERDAKLESMRRNNPANRKEPAK